jgi:hypothetical protein
MLALGQGTGTRMGWFAGAIIADLAIVAVDAPRFLPVVGARRYRTVPHAS